MKPSYFIFVFMLPFLLLGQKNNLTAEQVEHLKKDGFCVGLPYGFPKYAMTRAFDSHWTFTPKYEFVPEIATVKRDTKFTFERLTVEIVDRNSETGMIEERYLMATSEMLVISIEGHKLYTGFDRTFKKSYVGCVELLKRIQFLMEETQRVGTFKEAKGVTRSKYGRELAKVMLLVNEERLGKSFRFEKFQSMYPYPCRLASQEEIEESILENDTTKAYISISEVDVEENEQAIINAGNGKTYTRRQSDFTFSKNLFTHRADVKILKKHLRRMVKKII